MLENSQPSYNNYLILDIESDSLDTKRTNIFVICAIDHEDNEYVLTNNFHEIMDIMSKYEYIVAHNGVRFDFEVLYRFGKIPSKIRDTLIDSKLAYPRAVLINSDSHRKDFSSKLIGKYSLEAFGYRMGNYKLQFHDFTKLSDEMITYCLQDCRVAKELFNHINKSKLLPRYDILYREYQVASLLKKQQDYGFYVDIVGATKLKNKLMQEKTKILQEMQEAFPPRFVKNSENLSPRLTKKVKGPYTNIKLEYFNPSSRKQICDRLQQLGWEPSNYTAKGTPIINEETLASNQYAEKLVRYLKITKDLGQLCEGENSIIECYNKDTHRIHGIVDTLAAGTHRMGHSKLNFTQINKTRDFRELFIAPAGKVLIGIDADALELMMLGYYLYKNGNIDYIRSVSVGTKENGDDVHTKTQIMTGLPSRNAAKTLNLGLYYRNIV